MAPTASILTGQSVYVTMPTATHHRAARLDRRTRSARAERDVALAVGQGHGNAEIAAALHLSVATVKGHVSRLLEKLEVDNRVQTALLVQEAGRQ